MGRSRGYVTPQGPKIVTKKKAEKIGGYKRGRKPAKVLLNSLRSVVDQRPQIFEGRRVYPGSLLGRFR